jgi:Tol biopolymer transport system component
MKSIAALGLAMLFGWPVGARAQLVPHDRWLTIETEHFRVHFPKGLEAEGKRGAINAERAWAELSTELKPPRGKVDLVIADNVDYVNGYASSFPSNRIVVFAHPPFDALELRNYDDWSRLVITHELTHVFHLDRAEGLWRLGRAIFGRHPGLFPNAYLPSWIVEGLAVYYESRVTGAGRLEGSQHYMLARAAAQVGRVPRIGELSRATSKFPGGEGVYAYGSLILDYLARTRGAENIPKFVERTSRVIWPISLNAKAKGVFGISFENAWRDWRDSLERASRMDVENVTSVVYDPVPRWRDLTRDGRYVASPQWVNDTTIIYAAANGRESTSAYTVTLSGSVKRIGRRNSLDSNVPLPDGTIVFAQPDYIDAFHYRNDLWISRDGVETRLTRGARLSQPDARADGEIVAVQSGAGTSRLVRVSADGKTIRAITAGDAATQWSEPSWSPDGSRIAAVRIGPGPLHAIVITDEDGGNARTNDVTRSITAAPSWSATGDAVLFSSNRSGIMQGYLSPLGGGSHPITRASTGFFNPEMSPDGRRLAALTFRFDGYHVGVAPMPFSPPNPEPAVERGRRDTCAGCRFVSTVTPMAESSVPAARGYSPWRSLAPRYWEPVITTSEGEGTFLGAATSGVDVIGRHSYFAQAAYNTKFGETEAFASYQYAGLGQPYLNFTAEQLWEHFGVFAESERAGDLTRRERTLGVSASFVRPRARTFSSIAIGAELESRAYSTDPDTLIDLLSPVFSRTRNYPSVVLSAGWSNTQRPALSISREDGVSLSATARQRWETDDFDNASRSVIGVAALYKSLDLPGFAHHVIAVRGAGGYADDRTISTFSVGGLSGGSLDVLEGISVGGERRTFGVRGFSPSSEQGIRALAGTVEYRAPLAAPSKRVPFIPILFDRISVSAFADAGRAFCPASGDSVGVCRLARQDSPWLASAGGEIDLDTAIQYDFPARFRIGVAVPVSGRAAVGANSASVYATVGSSF